MIVYFTALKAYNLKPLITTSSGDVLPPDQSLIQRVDKEIRIRARLMP